MTEKTETPYAVAVGDMVITPSGRMGLLQRLSCRYSIPHVKTGCVQFVQNGPLTSYAIGRLRRATRDEIDASDLAHADG